MKTMITDSVNTDLRMENEWSYEPIREGSRLQPAGDGRVAEMYKDYDLYLAAKNGDLDNFKRVLDRLSAAESAASIRILSRLSPNGNTFLHVAAKYGQEGIVAFITSMKPSSFMLVKNFSGDTALQLVARAGNESMVKALVQIYRDMLIPPQYATDGYSLLRVENKQGNTALHEALLNGRDSIAQYLIQQDPELSYHRNYRESALYMAAKNDLLGCVFLILSLCTDEQRLFELFMYKSPIEAAIKAKHRDVLEAILEKNPRLIEMRDGEGRNPLHFAASSGYLEGARYLLKKYALNATVKDKEGNLPIHLAASEGHVDVVSLLLREFSDAGELLDTVGSNILHVAAKSGRYNVFSFVLKNHDLDYLINMKDIYGNTPLHYASKSHHPKIVITLTWDERVDIKAVNNQGMTALDAVEMAMAYYPQFRQRLTWAALKSASVPRNDSKQSSGYDRTSKKGLNVESYKERVNTLLLVATLVATVTFAAGFTMPGGYNSSDSGTDLGMATMLRDKGFHMFVFCDTIAMYSSIVVAAILIWAQLGDLGLAITALTVAVPLLGVALIMMSMAFTAGVFVVVSKLWWLRTAVVAIGISFIGILFMLLLPLCTEISSENRILRFFSYYTIWVLILVTDN